MRRSASALALVVLAACSSSRSSDELPSTIPPPDPHSNTAGAVSDTRVVELQTQLTELLERMDVLNARIAKLESGQGEQRAAGSERVVQTPAPVPVPSAPQKPLQSAQTAESYRRAIVLFSQSRYADARSAFQQVFDTDPAGDLADNALFWIGETYFAGGHFSDAMRYYGRVAKDYADQNKAPDALFKMGIAYERTGDLGMARRTFEECIAKYPYSSPASAARAELKKIKY